MNDTQEILSDFFDKVNKDDGPQFIGVETWEDWAKEYMKDNEEKKRMIDAMKQ